MFWNSDMPKKKPDSLVSLVLTDPEVDLGMSSLRSVDHYFVPYSARSLGAYDYSQFLVEPKLASRVEALKEKASKLEEKNKEISEKLSRLEFDKEQEGKPKFQVLVFLKTGAVIKQPVCEPSFDFKKSSEQMAHLSARNIINGNMCRADLLDPKTNTYHKAKDIKSVKVVKVKC